MNNMRNILIILIIFPCLAFAQERTLPSENTEPGAWKFGLRTDYAKGNYGTPDKYTDAYATLSGQYDWERVSLKISMPYIWSRAETQKTQVVFDEDGGLLCSENCPVVNQTDKVSGRGNLALSLSYSLPKEEDRIALTMTGKVRLGTADPDKGLGTGKTDYSLDFEFSRAFGDLTPFLGVGYRWRGKTPESSLVDSPYAWAGLIYSFSDATDAELMYSYRRPSSISSTSLAGRDASVSLYHKLSQRIRLNASIGKGISVNNPDWYGGLGIGVRY
jgi:hypothetical protein